jgi:hypothetical protein
MKVQYALQRLALLSRNGQEGELRKFFNEFLPEAQLTINGEGSSAVNERVPSRLAAAGG